MLLLIAEAIESKIKKYTDAYAFFNDKDLNVAINMRISEDNKEYLLNDIDKILPSNLIFSHTYNNGECVITFKPL